MSEQTTEELRNHDRASFRTAVTVIRVEDEQIFRMHTDDISASGVKLVSRLDVQLDEVYLMVMMPGLSDQLICGQVLRRSFDDFSRTHQFAVKFTRVCTVEQRSDILNRVDVEYLAETV